MYKIMTSDEAIDIIKDGDNTIITFTANDNIGIAPNYYIDIQMKKGTSTDSITFSQLYVETKTNSAGEYVLNLGNIGDSDIALMVEDQAGNQNMTRALSKIN